MIGPIFRISGAYPNRGHYRRARLAQPFAALAEEPKIQSSKFALSVGASDSLIPYLTEVARTAENYEEVVSHLRVVRDFIRKKCQEIDFEAGAERDKKLVSLGLQKAALSAMKAGLLPSLGNYDDAIVVLSNSEANNLVDGTASTDAAAEHCNDDVVEAMVKRGKNGLPPVTPYFHDAWESPVEFLYVTYRHLLSADLDDNSLYQDQLSWIHPSKRRLAEITGQVELYGSDEWGEDLMQALRNYFAKRGGAKALAEVIPTKKQRNDKKFRKLGLSDADIADQQKRSAASFLKI